MGNDKIFELPKEKEFIISGTIDEMISILNSDFGLDNEEARLVAYIETLEKKEKVEFEEKELKLWYLNEETPNTSPIFHLPYTISITRLKLELYRALYIFLGTYLISKEVGLLSIGLDFIWALKEIIQKIVVYDYCIYGRIVDLYFLKKEIFAMEEIIPYDKNNECNRKPSSWKCPHWHTDRCSLTEQRIQDILDKLEQKGVLTRVGQYWKMVK